MKTYESGKTSLVPLLGQTYERSLLIRNTYGCVQLLRGWQWGYVGVLAVRYGRDTLTGVAGIPDRQSISA
jgi:hypothetical protein